MTNTDFKKIETHLRRIDPETGEVHVDINITKNELRKGGYYSVIYVTGSWELATANLSKTALRLAFWILSQADFQDEIDIPQTHISQALKTDRATVNKAFKELEAIHFIYRTKRYNRIIYTLNPQFATRGRHRDAKLATYNEWCEHREAERRSREAEQDEASRLLAEEANPHLPLKERIDIERIDIELLNQDL
ncbi:MAG: replication/maintenance protein RepL [Synergistaceae bacterium]|nr:replication/maintenance protein RepL [Synergistaceae bacterium]